MPSRKRSFQFSSPSSSLTCPPRQRVRFTSPPPALPPSPSPILLSPTTAPLAEQHRASSDDDIVFVRESYSPAVRSTTRQTFTLDYDSSSDSSSDSQMPMEELDIISTRILLPARPTSSSSSSSSSTSDSSDSRAPTYSRSGAQHVRNLFSAFDVYSTNIRRRTTFTPNSTPANTLFNAQFRGLQREPPSLSSFMRNYMFGFDDPFNRMDFEDFPPSFQSAIELGLNESEFNLLQTRKFCPPQPACSSSSSTRSSRNTCSPELKDPTCVVCQDDYQPNDTLITLPECNHVFHQKCVTPWLKKHVTCPMCRKDVRQAIKNVAASRNAQVPPRTKRRPPAPHTRSFTRRQPVQSIRPTITHRTVSFRSEPEVVIIDDDSDD